MSVHKIFWLTILIVPQILSGQAFNNPKVVDTVDVTYSFYRQFDGISVESMTNSLQLEFDPISEREYLGYAKKYKPDLQTDSTRVSFHDHTFFMTAGDTVFKHRCPEPSNRAEYLGFYPRLDCFMIGLQGPGVYFRFLIDRETAKGISLPVLNYDFADGTPMISPKGKSMIYSITNHFDIGASIVFFDIGNHPDILTLNSYYTYDTNEWRIDDMTWINDSTIALKVYEEIGKDDKKKNIHFLKAEIEEKNTGANNK